MILEVFSNPNAPLILLRTWAWWDGLALDSVVLEVFSLNNSVSMSVVGMPIVGPDDLRGLLQPH